MSFEAPTKAAARSLQQGDLVISPTGRICKVISNQVKNFDLIITIEETDMVWSTGIDSWYIKELAEYRSTEIQCLGSAIFILFRRKDWFE